MVSVVRPKGCEHFTNNNNFSTLLKLIIDEAIDEGMFVISGAGNGAGINNSPQIILSEVNKAHSDCGIATDKKSSFFSCAWLGLANLAAQKIVTIVV